MNDFSLSLMTGVDIPIEECQLILHQPTIKEISLLGEKEFFLGLSVLNINKNMCQDAIDINQINNFQIFMMIMQDASTADKKQAVLDVLMILFPQYKIISTPRSLLFNLNEENFIIDESNFEYLQKVLSKVFCLSKNSQDDYKPANSKAEEIAKKLMRGRQRVAAQKEAENLGKSQLVQYLSVLTVGLKSMRLEDIINLTIFQLYDLIERYILFVNWDLDIRARMAGASSEKPIEDWMKSIH